MKPKKNSLRNMAMQFSISLQHKWNQCMTYSQTRDDPENDTIAAHPLSFSSLVNSSASTFSKLSASTCVSSIAGAAASGRTAAAVCAPAAASAGPPHIAASSGAADGHASTVSPKPESDAAFTLALMRTTLRAKNVFGPHDPEL